ncbi:unnamed protein product [Paramecium octaurelia]|uniref:Uncharacterized protein n=1 Tax=Paramecium octaurelia TaxID=43137 RepID=A0A8S1X418_PAROT|nr:unnamed protein product [Paramecium octaurelia]
MKYPLKYWIMVHDKGEEDLIKQNLDNRQKIQRYLSILKKLFLISNAYSQPQACNLRKPIQFQCQVLEEEILEQLNTIQFCRQLPATEDELVKLNMDKIRNSNNAELHRLFLKEAYLLQPCCTHILMSFKQEESSNCPRYCFDKWKWKLKSTLNLLYTFGRCIVNLFQIIIFDPICNTSGRILYHLLLLNTALKLKDFRFLNYQSK